MKETEAITIALDNIKKKKEAEELALLKKEEAKKRLKENYMSGINEQVQEKQR